MQVLPAAWGGTYLSWDLVEEMQWEEKVSPNGS